MDSVFLEEAVALLVWSTELEHPIFFAPLVSLGRRCYQLPIIWRVTGRCAGAE